MAENAERTKPPDRIDLAAARALVSGYAPEEAVPVKAGSVLALIEAVQVAYRGGPENDESVNGNCICLVCRTWSARGENRHQDGCAGSSFTFGGDAAA